MANIERNKVFSMVLKWAGRSNKFLLFLILCGVFYAVPVTAEDTPIPAYITDGSLFELEGETPHPLINETTLQFLPLEAQVATTNGNGWRQEYKIDQPLRLPMGATYELYKATYTIDMSDGAKSIIAQHHGDSPTLMKLYYADTAEDGLVDSVGGNGIFDLYVRMRSVDLNGGEDVFAFGTLEAGDTFDLIVENNYGSVSVTALGQTFTRTVMETPSDYFKFGNYLQAQVTTDESHPYGGEKCSALEPPLGFAECYEWLGITESVVTLTNVSYERIVDPDYELPPPEANLELLNGDFEDSLNEWTQEEPVASSGDTHTGLGSAKIEGPPGRFYQRVEVLSNTDYEFTGYVKGEGAVGIKGTLGIDDVADGEIDLMETFDVSDWTLVTISFTTGDDPLPVYVYGLHGSSGDVRFDDFTLETDSPPITGNNFCPSGNAAPATVFDLANWRIKVPDAEGTTYDPDELATLNNDYFCLTDDDAMVFYAAVTGGTGGSTYPRSELREMIDTGSSSVGWVISGTHSMSAETTVTLEPSNGKIVIAQVDSQSDDILAKIQWDNDRIRVQLRQIDPDGSPGDYENYWFDSENTSWPVGTTFEWDMTVEDGVLYVTLDGETVTHEFATIPEPANRSVSTPSDYADDEFYFSAGSQPQDNTQDDPKGEPEAAEVLFHSFDVTHIDALETSSIYCPSTNGAPATVFDLANWRIKVPDDAGTTYSPEELATLDNEFFCLSDDGAMVMYAPVEGGTAGSTYPRTELREMVDPSSSSVGWVISGTHSMSAETTVTLEPSNGKIVIAQVDSLSDDILAKIQWDNDKIRVQLRQIDPDGAPGDYENYWFDDESASWPVGTTFEWDMTVEDGVLYVTLDGDTVAHEFATIPEPTSRSVLTPSDYADDEFYFSAGSQPQDNTQDDPEGAQEAGEVLFHSLDVTHGDSAEPTGCPGTNGPPANVFDLANWRIKIPDEGGTTYQPDELATLDNEFFCLSDDGAMVFYVPVEGGTGGSTYPRSELREMVNPDSSDVGWVISGTHKMEASTTVMQEPSNGKIVIAQIDSLTDDILAKIQWDNDRIRVQLRQIDPDGSPGDYENYWFDDENGSWPVGTNFDWDMTVTDGVLTVTVDGDTVTHDFTMLSTSPTDYADDEFYFSAGSQPQDNVQDDPLGPTEAAEVLFYSLDVTHEAPKTGPNICPTSNGAPATMFDLANWRIKIPDEGGTTYQPDELATLDNEFFCLSDDGAMVFYAPVEGGTAGSTYPRSELREMVDPSSSGVGWPITGTHTMSATTTVTQEPSNGKIVIAQVDSQTDDILAKIQWDNDKIRVQLRQIDPDGSPGDYENYWFDGESTSFTVGTTFDWEMTVIDGILYVTVNDDTVVHDFTTVNVETNRQGGAASIFPSDYADDEFYFSAGSQPQDNTQDDPTGAPEAAEVLFHLFKVTHEDDDPSAVTLRETSTAESTLSAGVMALVLVGFGAVTLRFVLRTNRNKMI